MRPQPPRPCRQKIVTQLTGGRTASQGSLMSRARTAQQIRNTLGNLEDGRLAIWPPRS